MHDQPYDAARIAKVITLQDEEYLKAAEIFNLSLNQLKSLFEEGFNAGFSR